MTWYSQEFSFLFPFWFPHPQVIFPSGFPSFLLEDILQSLFWARNAVEPIQLQPKNANDDDDGRRFSIISFPLELLNQRHTRCNWFTRSSTGMEIGSCHVPPMPLRSLLGIVASPMGIREPFTQKFNCDDTVQVMAFAFLKDFSAIQQKNPSDISQRKDPDDRSQTKDVNHFF